MTAISSHGGKTDVKILLGSLPYSYYEAIQTTTDVDRSGIGYALNALKATSTVTKAAATRYPANRR